MVYVSQHGSQDMSCGTSLEQPCIDLHHVIANINDDDEIYIDARGTVTNPIQLCSPQYVAKSFSMIGIYGQPVIECVDVNIPLIHSFIILSQSPTA